MQQKSKNSALAVILFAVCLGTGFGVTSLLKGGGEKGPDPDPTVDTLTRYKEELDTIVKRDTIEKNVVEETTIVTMALYKHVDIVRDGDTIYGSGELMDKKEEIINVERYKIKPNPILPNPTPVPIPKPEHKVHNLGYAQWSGNLGYNKQPDGFGEMRFLSDYKLACRNGTISVEKGDKLEDAEFEEGKLYQGTLIKKNGEKRKILP